MRIFQLENGFIEPVDENFKRLEVDEVAQERVEERRVEVLGVYAQENVLEMEKVLQVLA